MKQAAIILAAGEASRFGSAKQLIEMEGSTLVQRACQLANAADCSPIYLILGAHAEAIQKTGIPTYVHTIVNPNWKNGMGSSLALGIKQLLQTDTQSTLVLLADQPAITLTTIEEMQHAFKNPETTIVICKHDQTSGPPSLFSSKHFPALASLNTDKGGKAIIQKHQNQVATIDTLESAWDIDTPEVWQRFIKHKKT